MSRLIDADMVLELIEQRKKETFCDGFGTDWKTGLNMAIEIIDEAPTEFDIEEVISQLEYNSSCDIKEVASDHCSDRDKCVDCERRKSNSFTAIDIVLSRGIL